jgi:hypothetical protein
MGQFLQARFIGMFLSLVKHATAIVHLEHPKLTFAYICDDHRLPKMMVMVMMMMMMITMVMMMMMVLMGVVAMVMVMMT